MLLGSGYLHVVAILDGLVATHKKIRQETAFLSENLEQGREILLQEVIREIKRSKLSEFALINHGDDLFVIKSAVDQL